MQAHVINELQLGYDHLLMGGGQILDLGSPTAGWTSFNMCLVTSQDNTVGFRFVYGVAGDRQDWGGRGSHSV